ncbi:hypothetical protein IWX90DRAFT_216010 [Phyllosticta citrichinensis]|uniref:Secreted protein n=1 Tax=Phyllosticta citrichinensis TaxID=1130410 RepID=A0ABR1XTV9_9PEZI
MLLLITFVASSLSHNLFLILVIFLHSVSSSCTLHVPFEALNTACDHPWTYSITPRMIPILSTISGHPARTPTTLGRFPILGRFPGRSPDSTLSDNVAAKGLRHVVIDRRRAPTPAFPRIPRAPEPHCTTRASNAVLLPHAPRFLHHSMAHANGSNSKRRSDVQEKETGTCIG